MSDYLEIANDVPRPASDDDKRAVGLYGVLARDIGDFVEMVRDRAATNGHCLSTLLMMLEHPTDEENQRTNVFGAEVVKAEIETRKGVVADVEEVAI